VLRYALSFYERKEKRSRATPSKQANRSLSPRYAARPRKRKGRERVTSCLSFPFRSVGERDQTKRTAHFPVCLFVCVSSVASAACRKVACLFVLSILVGVCVWAFVLVV